MTSERQAEQWGQEVATIDVVSLEGGYCPSKAGRRQAILREMAALPCDAVGDEVRRRFADGYLGGLVELARFDPAVADYASAKTRKETEQRLQHAVAGDAQYVREVESINVEKAILQKRHPHKPEQVAARETALAQLEDRKREAREAAEDRLRDSKEFAGYEERLQKRETEIQERYAASSKIIAGGFKSEDARIAYLQTHPEARERFLGAMKAGKSAKAMPTIREILSGTGSGGAAYATFLKESPSPAQAAEAFDTLKRAIESSPRQQVMAGVRTMEAGRETIESAPEVASEALAGAVSANQKQLLEDLGEGDAMARLMHLGTQLSGDETGTFIAELQQKQRWLREPKLRQPVTFGATRASWARRGPAYSDASPRELAQADQLQPIINGLKEVQAAVKENTAHREHIAGRNSRPALGGPNGDPGDPHHHGAPGG